MKEAVLQKYKELFGTEALAFFAPGRVNLIGEHTDYNGGHVFPCALTIGTFEKLGVIEVPVENLVYDKKDNWANYPKGVIRVLKDHGYEITDGIDIVYYGNIPNASGLSSSASLEVLTAFIAKTLCGLKLDFVEISKLTQEAENRFIGVNCGIMDQFAIAMGKKDHAIFLDTATLKYEYAPIKLDGCKIVIACSNKKRGLGDSKYNERRQECEDALAALQKVLPVKTLGELTEDAFEANRSAIGDPVKERRAKHAVYENQRTIRAVQALKAGDLKRFGELMNESHVSLRDDYEVTGIELDTLVENAWKQEGVIGSRMTGAGFGGCTVSIVREDGIDSFIRNVGEAYLAKIGYAADFYVVEIGDGPVVL